MSNTTKFTSNFLWRFLERCGAQGVTFVVSIVLARILLPEVYGVVAIVTVFTSILNVFIDSGLGTALVQKKDADDLDFSTVFWFNIGMCLLLYVIMFFAAGPIAVFYDMPELKSVVRVMSITLIISGIKNIQISYVAKQMIFKKFFFATLAGTIGAAALGIFMAYKGFGVWALIVQGLFNNFVDMLILWITVKFRPKFIFSWERLKSLLSYGWKLLVSKLLDTVYTNLRQLIIGKKYTAEDLAFYNRGEHFPRLFVENINSSIDSVLLPTMAAEQDNIERVKEMTRKAIQVATYVMMPLMMGLAVCSEPMIKLLMTDKWLFCIPYLRIFCFCYAFQPIHTANLNAIKALGRSDLFLKLEIIKKIVGLAVLLISMWYGVMVMAYSLIIISITGQIINSWPNKKLLNYSYPQQIKDIMPQILLSVFMGAVVYCVSFLPIHYAIILAIQIPVGIAVYVAGSILFKISSFYYLLDTIKSFKNRKKTPPAEADGE